MVCAGTYYGQELYKVTLLSIAATTFGQLILRFGYFYWLKKKKEFLIPDAVLAVVYIQSVVWVSDRHTCIHTHTHIIKLLYLSHRLVLQYVHSYH